MEAALQINSSHAHQLFQHRVIAFNLKWQAIPHDQLKLNPHILQDSNHSKDENTTPRMVIFLLERNNKYLPMLEDDLSPPEKNSEWSSSDPAQMDRVDISQQQHVQDQDEWVKRYTKQIDEAREGFDEYFDYLKKHQLVSSLKMHDSYYERWSQFNHQFSAEGQPVEGNDANEERSFMFFVKILNDGTLSLRGESKPTMKYEIMGTLAFGVKHVIVNGERMKIGITGSGWVPPKFRGVHETKLVPWFLHLHMFKEMGVRYYYAHVFEENTRCLGFVEKTGLFPSKLRMNFIGVKLPLVEEKVESSSLKRIETFERYNSLMRKLYGSSNFLVDRLENIFFHRNFEGCYVDEVNNLTFQLWKGKYGVDATTNEQYPAFMIMNMTQADSPIDVTSHQLDLIQHHLQSDLIPSLIQSKNFTNISHTYLYHVTNSQAMKVALCERHLDNPSLSVAFLAYTFQDNDMFMHYLPKRKSESNHSTVPKSEQVWNFMMGEYAGYDKNMNLFLDPRDCTSKPLVWSQDIKTSLSLLGEGKVSRPSTSSAPTSKPVVQEEASPVSSCPSCSPVETNDLTQTNALTHSSTSSPEPLHHEHSSKLDMNSNSNRRYSSLLKWSLILTPTLLVALFGVKKMFFTSNQSK
ncbi:hypothetical protein C9374_012728 [Naegleria lovaniensis]|uniref:Uncharacterized protein n=1 Tax=Naegleria lovaniensis TaxID=51637 RepID=A0AA88H1S0_NAELO|nr:uncharacterized protein C9374_012728 [Naegleria lovaniensis]KAG2392476.1 hypothetical protein C9374_012728 [Naegleria lovaniensis]